MSKVLRPEEMPAGGVSFNLADFEREAREITARARREAQAITAEARGQAGEIAREAREQGRRAGREEGLRVGTEEGRGAGREEGLAACRRDTATLAEALGKLAAELGARRAALIQEAEQDLLALAAKVAERIVRRELELDREAAARAVIEAVGLAAERSRITVRVNPADLAAVREAHEELHRRFAELKDVELVGDESVERGGCRVLTAGGEVDMQVGTQLERIGRLLAGEGGE